VHLQSALQPHRLPLSCVYPRSLGPAGGQGSGAGRGELELELKLERLPRALRRPAPPSGRPAEEPRTVYHQLSWWKAHVTCLWLLAGVNKLVPHQMMRPREGLFAQGTRVGLLTCVDQLASLSANSLGEILVTQVMCVELLTCVNKLVIVKATFLGD
jgi:hypothetical protein